MNSDEVTAWVRDNNEWDASALFNERLPKMGGRLTRAANTLKKLLKEIKEEFPEATYYTASGGFTLLLGHTHGGSEDLGGEPHQERCVWGAIGLTVGDGDY